MKLDPEERIIAAALDQAVLNPANERGAGAQIEFSREGRQGACHFCQPTRSPGPPNLI
jgi:hypothetical protein